MSSTIGSELEARVLNILSKLVSAGLARDLRPQDRVQDSGGCIRKIDFTVVLCTNLVDIRVTIECKSKKKTLSLDDIDQIKTYKRELTERNVFWLVYEGSLNSNVQKSLKNNGVSTYTVDELDAIVHNVITKYGLVAGSVVELHRQIDRFSTMNPMLQSKSEMALHSTLGTCFKPFEEVSEVLSAETSQVHRQFHDLYFFPPHSEELKPYLAALDTKDPEASLVKLLIELRRNGGTQSNAEDLLMDLRCERSEDDTNELIKHVRQTYVDLEEKRCDLVYDYEDLEKAYHAQSDPKGVLNEMADHSEFWKDMSEQYDILGLIADGRCNVIKQAIDEYIYSPMSKKRYIFSDGFDEAFIKKYLKTL